MDNKLKTIGFLSCLREMIALSTDYIDGITESEKDDINNFIMKESSDYEILHFIGTGEFPNEKYNQEMEEICVDFVKEKLQENYFDLSEILGENETDTLIESLEPLTQSGLSSNSVILTHLIETGLTKQQKQITSLINNNSSLNSRLANLKKDRKDHENKIKQDKIKSNKKTGNKNVLNNLEDNALSSIRQDLNKKSKPQAKAEEPKKQKSSFPSLKERSAKKREAWTQATKGKSAASKLATAKAFNVFPKGDAKGPGKLKTGTDVFPKGDAKGPNAATTKPESASSLAQTTIKFVKDHQKSIGATVLGAGLLYGAYRTYKRFFSKAARACSGKSGAERDACVVNFKKNAIKAQISDLKKSTSACKSTNNPQKCQAGISSKIQKLQAKI